MARANVDRKTCFSEPQLKNMTYTWRTINQELNKGEKQHLDGALQHKDEMMWKEPLISHNSTLYKMMQQFFLML